MKQFSRKDLIDLIRATVESLEIERENSPETRWDLVRLYSNRRPFWLGLKKSEKRTKVF